MNVVDSSCWLEYFADTPAAAPFRAVIEDTRNLIVPTIVIAEVCRRASQLKGAQGVKQVTVQMSLGQVADLDRAIALASVQIGVELKLPLADSIILATARTHGATLWTQDAHFQNLDNVRYFEKK